MGGSRTMENVEYGNGTVLNNGKYGIREWNGPEQWKIWKSGMERPRAIENMEIGMERSRTMENVEIGK